MRRNPHTSGAFTVGATNLPIGVSAMLVCSTSLINAVWTTNATFTTTSAATNWIVPATDPAGFFRLQIMP